MRSMIVLVGLLAGLVCGRCNGEENELYSKLSRLEDRVELLENDLKALPKVAFSVALREFGSGNLGPFQIDTPIQYKKVFSNIGNYYNPATGTFTAMVRGVYFFTYSVYNNVNMTPTTIVVLKKNGERTVSAWDTSGTDANDSASNAVVLELEVGDGVWVSLVGNTMVFDDEHHYTTFNGFLLFAV